MAEAAGYPKVPAKAWRVLRTRAATAPSTKFTPSTVAALLTMGSAASAQTNVVAPLQRLGLFDESGALTARGNKWRVDASYEDACSEILKDVYPDDLAALTDELGAPDRAKVTTWLQHKGFGGSNAKQMAATYVMIAERTLPDASAGAEPRKAPAKKAAKKAAKVVPATTDDDQTQRVPPVTPSGDGRAPNVHLDIQIHIPADASLEQIDQIFASMAKHLYGR